MGFYKRHKKFIRMSATILFSSGLGWLGMQVYKTRNKLNTAFDTSVIDLLEPVSKKDHAEEDSLMKKMLKKYEVSYSTILSLKWSALKFQLAQHLIGLANCDIKTLRKRALSQLAKISNFEDWQYMVLASMCDARTAISLSRIHNVDSRLIFKPYFSNLKLTHEEIIKMMRDFLHKLNSCSSHLCMAYFFERAFPDDQEVHKFLDQDYPCVGLTRMIESANDILPVCIESILHHSSIEEHAQDIALQNGLPLLMEVHKMFQDNIDVKISLCKILSNISIFPQFIEEIFNTGWVRVLSEWVKDPDLRLSLPAAKALTNMDVDKDFNGKFSRGIYLLHPTFQMFDKVLVDVIFVHGLLGGVFFTWRQRLDDKETIGLIGKQRDKESISNETAYPTFLRRRGSSIEKAMEDIMPNDWECTFEFVLNDLPINSNEEGAGPFTFPCQQMQKPLPDSYSQCWPKDWLPEDCKNLRVIGVNYDTTLSMWSSICPQESERATIEQRSNEIMSKLLKAGVGERPIVWVTHSMGGLIVKNLLCKAWESDIKELRNICTHTKSIVFYSTPHKGSKVANVSPPTEYVVWPSVEVQELRRESPKLKEIHKKFKNLVCCQPMKVISFVETKPILVTAMKFNFLLVEPESGNPGVGEYFEIPQDHLGICKPKNKHSFLYQKVLHIIMEAVKEEKFGYRFLEKQLNQ